MEGEVEGLHDKFHVNVFTVSASGGQKPQLLENFEYWGLLYECVKKWCNPLSIDTKMFDLE